MKTTPRVTCFKSLATVLLLAGSPWFAAPVHGEGGPANVVGGVAAPGATPTRARDSEPGSATPPTPLNGLRAIQHHITLLPASSAEAEAVVDNNGSTVDHGQRRAQPGQGWTYRAAAPAEARWDLVVNAKGAPQIAVCGSDGKPIAAKATQSGDTWSIRALDPAGTHLGGELRIRISSGGEPIAVSGVQLTFTLPDRHGDGLGDLVEGLMGLKADERATVVPRPATAQTGFFLAQPYEAAMAVPADAVQLYAGLESTADSAGLGRTTVGAAVTGSWVSKGYFTHVFLHSRYGSDVRKIPAENQTDDQGRPIGVIAVYEGEKQVDLAVGPVTSELAEAMRKKHHTEVRLEMVDHYMIPTQARIDFARQYYREALNNNVSEFCFDEPEIWSNAGYSEAFKDEWLTRYGSAWQPPDGSVDARYQAEQLKSFLIRRWFETVLDDVRAQHPAIRRMIAMHSPTNYYEMGMSTPHHNLVSIPALDEVVAEVWNDPFDLSYLEYSSFRNLTRGTGKQLWFMMDPWGDSPAMSLDYYRRSYGNNLLAALMFPEVNRFQPLIWPNRLFGHVPKEYETLINTVTGALGEMWRYRDGRLEAGNPGIGTFVADSMGWQRADPAPSDFEGYYGLTTPLVQNGVPVDVLSLDRAAEPAYLDGAKCLLVSYDFLKPGEAAQNRALADWTRQGGTLVCFGGSDAYNAVAGSWWAQAGHASPLEELFARMGVPIAKPTVLAEPGRILTLEPTTENFGPATASLTIPLGQHPGREQARNRVNFWQSEEKPKEFTHTYPVTVYAPPSGAKPLYCIKGTAEPVVWSAPVGRGTVLFVGVSPGFLKTSEAGSAWVRALAKYALEKAGASYRERPYFHMRRGPYTAIRTLGQPYTAAGRYIDLLSPTLALLENPVIPPQECAFLIDAGPSAGTPLPPCASGRLRAYHLTPDVTSFLVQAPAKTDGAARVWAGQRRAKQVAAANVLGAPVPIKFETAGDTVLLRYANDADGVVVRIEWNPASAGK